MRRALSLTVALLLAGGVLTPTFAQASSQFTLRDVFRSPVIRVASRSHARLRMLRPRSALATENVGGARVGRGAVVGRAVCLPALDLAAGLHVTINQRLVRGGAFSTRLDDSVMG